MARKRKKTTWHAGELNLTAMIDIAFQLLNFFIITSHPVDVNTNLNVFRPAPDTKATPDVQPANMIRIQVFSDGYTINERFVTADTLGSLLKKLADMDKNQTILIICEGDSQHSKLVDVLDQCARVGLVNLSVVSAAVGGR